MASNYSPKFNLICFLWFHKWDKTKDPCCYRCNKFKNKEDSTGPHLFTREARNYAARQIQARRELGILDPEHDD